MLYINSPKEQLLHVEPHDLDELTTICRLVKARRPVKARRLSKPDANVYRLIALSPCRHISRRALAHGWPFAEKTPVGETGR